MAFRGDRVKANTKASGQTPRRRHRRSSIVKEKLSVLSFKSDPNASNIILTEIVLLPKFSEVPAPDRTALFIRKLEQCSAVNPIGTDMAPAVAQAMDIKRRTLEDIVDYINQTRSVFKDSTVLATLIRMVAANIFRPLPKPTADLEIFDPEEDEPKLEQNWPVLQLVYDIFLRFIISPEIDPKVAKKHIDSRFVTQMIALFDSEDPRERDYLKTALHWLYAKLMAYRAFIRRTMNATMYHFTHHSMRFSGISEFLEIYGSIINGFALPLKPEHLNFLHKTLMPLHRVDVITHFHVQLSYCVTQFIEKDTHLIEPIVKALLRYWPITSSPKAVLFLNELEDLLELTPPAEFSRILDPVLTLLGQCVSSTHFHIAERALTLINNNEVVAAHIASTYERAIPILFHPLCYNTKTHWNQTILSYTFNALKTLMGLDATLFNQCAEQFKGVIEDDSASVVHKQEKWDALSLIAAGKDPELAALAAERASLAPKFVPRFPMQSKAREEVESSEPELDTDSEEEEAVVKSPSPRSPHLKMRRKSVLPTQNQRVTVALDSYIPIAQRE
ncbi:Protein phosphatase 2A, regulatory B subunit, B56 [Carpediemonas membranifera]|uniref:Serine/threonine protein phosphatase 2A regulatory subunit n=1 Tax=Carpediemonas membranifera TaxID=201153 RepID=A0A8J6B9Z9_9EUKA|nr:Protein phosphatase 2A, regulatory B subunit, B56 [Carpediemonas membranifera]|eukprot:KAG9396344.1 Protein phosphatase 2A, regulatory B subunit, B56 [Carpediemonas membranifera]